MVRAIRKSFIRSLCWNSFLIISCIFGRNSATRSTWHFRSSANCSRKYRNTLRVFNWNVFGLAYVGILGRSTTRTILSIKSFDTRNTTLVSGT
uniref:Putative secreted protein n=1 Tax=Xenopsylla cheopis TaxID=163159 RepID=A0A6M2E084_XENCH